MKNSVAGNRARGVRIANFCRLCASPKAEHQLTRDTYPKLLVFWSEHFHCFGCLLLIKTRDIPWEQVAVPQQKNNTLRVSRFRELISPDTDPSIFVQNSFRSSESSVQAHSSAGMAKQFRPWVLKSFESAMHCRNVMSFYCNDKKCFPGFNKALRG